MNVDLLKEKGLKMLHSRGVTLLGDIVNKYYVFFTIVSIALSQAGACYVNMVITGDKHYDIVDYILFFGIDLFLVIVFCVLTKECGALKKTLNLLIFIGIINYFTADTLSMFQVGLGISSLYLISIEKKYSNLWPFLLVMTGVGDSDVVWVVLPIVIGFYCSRLLENKRIAKLNEIVFAVVFLTIILEKFFLFTPEEGSTLYHDLVLVGERWNGLLLSGIVYWMFGTLVFKERSKNEKKWIVVSWFCMIFTLAVFGSRECLYVLPLLACFLFLIPSCFEKTSIKTQADYCRGNIKKLLLICACTCAMYETLKLIGSFFVGTPDKYMVSQFYMDYFHFGFGQRGFVGTLIYLLFGYDVPLNRMILINLILCITAIVLIVILLYKLVSKYGQKDRNIVTFFLLFLAVGGLFTHVRGVSTFDVFNILILLLCLNLILKGSNLMFLVPFLSGVAMCIHPIYALLMFPVLVAAFFTVIAINENNRKRNILVLVMSTIIVMVLFAYFIMFSRNFLIGDVNRAVDIVWDRMGEKVQQKYRATVFEKYYMMFYREVLFPDFSSHLSVWKAKFSLDIILHSIVNILLMIPLFLYYFSSFFDEAKKRKGVEKLLLAVAPFSILSLLPCYVLEVDYYRWDLGLLFFAFVNTLVLMLVKKQNGESEEVQNDRNWKKYFCILMCLFPFFRIYYI